MFLNVFSWDHKGGQGPWGKSSGGSAKKVNNPRRTGGGSNRPQGPDLDDMIKAAQRKVNQLGSGNNGNNSNGNSGMIKFAVIGAVLLWLASGFYIVAPDEEGVVLRFGKYVQTTSSGLNYHLPMPIETVIKPKVTSENITEVGFRNPGSMSGFSRFAGNNYNSGSTIDVAAESLMLTGDENIVDLDFTVRWKIADPRDFLFNVSNPTDTIKNVAESVMREVIGRHPIDDALTDNKTIIQKEAKILVQEVLDGYKAGVQINGLELQKVNPPKEVIDAFRDVQAARADAEKMQNEAKGYANDILPRARGEAAQILQLAEGYKAAKVAESEGAAERFESQLAEYRKAKNVTTKRMYLETMEEVLSTNKKVIFSDKSGQGVLPYLPLQQLQNGGKK